MSTKTPVTGTERVLIEAADGQVILPSAIAAYTIDVLAAATTATPTVGDYVVCYRGTDEKRELIQDVATYALTYAYSNASTLTPAATGDSLLVQRGATLYDMNIDSVVTYVLTTTVAAATPLQAGVLNTSGLGSATLVATDLIPICPVGAPTVPKTVALSALETKLWTDYATYVAGLTAITTPADTNKFYALEGSTPKYVTATVLAEYMSDEIIAHGDIQAAVLSTLDEHLTALDAVGTIANTDLFYTTKSGVAKKVTALEIANFAAGAAVQLPWKQIPVAKYTHDTDQTTPSSTSVILMTDTSDFKKGSPVKYTYAGNTYYGIVSALSANTSITISGAPLVVVSPITALYAGLPTMVTQVDYTIPGAFGASVRDLLLPLSKAYVTWKRSKAYLVRFAVTAGTADTGATQPKVNVKVNGSVVCTTGTSTGLSVSSTPGSWNDATGIDIDTTTYDINPEEAIEVRCTAAGTNTNAADLSISLLFVSE